MFNAKNPALGLRVCVTNKDTTHARTEADTESRHTYAYIQTHIQYTHTKTQPNANADDS